MWNVFKFNPFERENELIDTIENMPLDCWGDDLYEILEERGIIKSIDNYEVDADQTGIALCGRDEDQDLFLEWVVDPKWLSN